ncbi:hypothetical protein [Hydrogenophaga sp. NH-16]|uniref:hypothetical protein n=1 Tax=Hydrogenophaga sp. NH-16 TaxID=2184519 RepID=UPI000FD8883A|nr:hypothetical protein [Hydrogenophaga sp. NH-16]
MNWKTLVFAALIGFGLWQHLQTRPVSTGPGVLAAAEPQQGDTTSDAFVFKGHTLQPLQDFSIEARVLASETYRSDRESALSPVDLVLGWGLMSDSAVLDQVKISQSGRFYYWRVEQFPIPRQEIEQSSANMHMIPADATIERRLKDVRPGQTVRIDGWLVEARGSDGWRWRSSLTRNDTGAGACEVIFVRDLQVL